MQIGATLLAVSHETLIFAVLGFLEGQCVLLRRNIKPSGAGPIPLDLISPPVRLLKHFPTNFRMHYAQDCTHFRELPCHLGSRFQRDFCDATLEEQSIRITLELEPPHLL